MIGPTRKSLVHVLRFEAPTEPGVYPYVCTYPGHWRRMYGAMYVVDDLEGYLADPAAYLAGLQGSYVPGAEAQESPVAVMEAPAAPAAEPEDIVLLREIRDALKR